MECSICLGIINETDKIKKLSCDHNFHFQCFLDLVYRDNNIYVNCIRALQANNIHVNATRTLQANSIQN